MKQFSKIPIATSERSKQNLSSSIYHTQDFGMLNPLYHVEVCPGDDIDLDVSTFMRMAPMPYPMHASIKHDVRVFFVPWRILQPHGTGKFVWDDYITGVSNASLPYASLGVLMSFLYQTALSTNDEFGFPQSVATSLAGKYNRDALRFFSMMGLPVQLLSDVNPSEVIQLSDQVRLWPFQAYQRIWWDYYRNSDLISEQLLERYFPPLVAGSNTIGASVLTNPEQFVHHFLMPRYACFGKDYFTTAKLYPQSGPDASSVGSLGEVFPTNIPLSPNNTPYDVWFSKNNGINQTSVFATGGTSVPSTTSGAVVSVQTKNNNLSSSYLQSNSSFTIEIFRRANALQKYLERNNIVGSRLIERFLARFGVAPSAEKLQMSEYLGGSSAYYNIGAVMSSADTYQAAGDVVSATDGFGMNMQQSASGGSIQGLSTGAGALNMNSGHIKYHAQEFGTLMVISTITPKVTYTQGLHKSWTRGNVDRFEFLTPEFDRLGYEAIMSNELDFNPGGSNQVFGYVPRYSSYKFKNDIKAGDLVLDGTNSSMDCVSLERYFVEQPVLTKDFTEIGPEQRYNLDRVFSFPGSPPSLNSTTFDHFTGYSHIECNVVRNMSDDGLPALDPDLDDDNKKILVQNGGIRF